MIAVITTINPPTQCIRELIARLSKINCELVVIGDKKGPTEYNLKNTIFLPLDVQLDLPFSIAKLLPIGHYARKNIGYLLAMAKNSGCIYETDDDNAPLDNWSVRDEIIPATRILKTYKKLNKRWINVYQYFTNEKIWPRGLALDAISNIVPKLLQIKHNLRAPVQQGLVNNSPDVDAIWRLVMDKPFNFSQEDSVFLESGNWCPFNTQSTWWWPVAYPLMYIPSNCSFRMCDIWRSFVAQRCLWAMGCGIAFHAPEVYQDRNEHNLLNDFIDEVPGYTHNNKFVDVLSNLKLYPGEKECINNLLRCYEALIEADIIPKKELELVKAWVDDIAKLGNANE